MQNLIDPAILFFVVGVIAGLVRSNLEIPAAISKFLSLYLLMAMGLKGGFALANAGITPQIAVSLGAALVMAVVVPMLGYAWLRRRLGGFDAAAVAASYGSVSAVTFVAAMQYLESQSMPFGGHMTVAMVLMESPAILFAVFMANRLRHEATGGVRVSGGGVATLTPGGGTPLGRILHESLTDGAQLLLLGALVVGCISGEGGQAMMKPFSGDLFKGMLAFFLLDMGLSVARNSHSLKGQPGSLLAYAVLGPALHATVALGLALMLRLPAADAALLMVLAASASYIVVPAVLRHAIPEAQPSLYLGLSLGITLPLNLLVGIPVCAAVARSLLG